eukprot:6139176-Prymnesium_polylepis.1
MCGGSASAGAASAAIRAIVSAEQISSFLNGLTAIRIGPIDVYTSAALLTSFNRTRSSTGVSRSPVAGVRLPNSSSATTSVSSTPGGACRRDRCTLPPNFSSTVARTHASSSSTRAHTRSFCVAIVALLRTRSSGCAKESSAARLRADVEPWRVNSCPGRRGKRRHPTRHRANATGAAEVCACACAVLVCGALGVLTCRMGHTHGATRCAGTTGARWPHPHPSHPHTRS